MSNSNKTVSNYPLPPGTLGLPFIGETLAFFVDANFVRRRHQKYGNIFKTHLFGNTCVFMIGPEAAEFVLSSHAKHFNWQDGWPKNFAVLFDKSLLLQDGAEHRRNRKLMMPAFHGQALINYFKTIEQITISYLHRWEQQQQGIIDFEDVKEFTFDAASQIFLGVAPGENIETLCDWFTVLTDGWSFFGLKKALSARENIYQHLIQVIQSRQANPTQDAISLLIQSTDENGDRLNLEEICAQTMTILLAGHETTTTTLNWILLELAWYKNIQQHAREEQLHLAQQGALSMEQLSKMPYLEQILLEVERLHPGTNAGFRGVVEPFEFNGFHVPAGWKLQFSILLTHQAAEVYTEPLRFDPDRFSPERQESKRKPYSLIGFGGGQRTCIGMAFAKLEMKIIMSYLLRNYEWEVLPKQNINRFNFSPIERNKFLKKWRFRLSPCQSHKM